MRGWHSLQVTISRSLLFMKPTSNFFYYSLGEVQRPVPLAACCDYLRNGSYCSLPFSKTFLAISGHWILVRIHSLLVGLDDYWKYLLWPLKAAMVPFCGLVVFFIIHFNTSSMLTGVIVCAFRPLAWLSIPDTRGTCPGPVPVGETVAFLPALMLQPMKIAPHCVSPNKTRHTWMHRGLYLPQWESPVSDFSL